MISKFYTYKVFVLVKQKVGREEKKQVSIQSKKNYYKSQVV